MTSTAVDYSLRASELLTIDAGREVGRIVDALRHQVGNVLNRRGLVVGMSSGVDSSVCAALAVEAFGPKRVFALMMPELDSDSESTPLAQGLADQLGIQHVVEDISGALAAVGCYQRRNDAVRIAVPEFEDDWAFKIVLPGARLDSDRLNVFSVAVCPPGGEVRTVRLPAHAYLAIVAATNFKQRIRKMLEYHHADRLHYAVTGTPNRVEYDQGFFVKGGDGLADVKPIAHLYKSQVYMLAEHLGVPTAITRRPPTTDTYSLPQTQEEFYFSLPTAAMDLVLYARNTGKDVASAAELVGLSRSQMERAFRDVDQKRATTHYLHERPLLVEDVPLPASAD